MPSYRLYYFDGRGTAEMSRIILAQAGVEFQDIRFENEEWGKNYKESKLRLCLLVSRAVTVLSLLKFRHSDVRHF